MRHAPTARTQFVEKFETSQRRYEPRGAQIFCIVSDVAEAA